MPEINRIDGLTDEEMQPVKITENIVENVSFYHIKKKPGITPPIIGPIKPPSIGF